MSREVPLPYPRYHNHLDRNISNEEWKVEEENQLFEMQDDVGNKWALIASKLPGRYAKPYLGPTIASKTISTPNCAKDCERSTRRSTSS